MPFTGDLPAVFSKDDFHSICDKLAAKDSDLAGIIGRFGYPPFWTRHPNFTTLIHFILEQQVSLASAKAALIKLQAYIGNLTPKKLLSLSDAELKACYFSRQKIVYARCLSNAILGKKLSLNKLRHQTDEMVRTELKKLKGIGDWTVDVFLMMSLHRTDLFPSGDVALIKSIKEVKQLPATTSKEEILLLATQWQPYRTIAAYLLWHSYLERRRKNPANKVPA
jgi:DNA-3-methyladenine glycosylase II